MADQLSLLRHQFMRSRAIMRSQSRPQAVRDARSLSHNVLGLRHIQRNNQAEAFQARTARNFSMID